MKPQGSAGITVDPGSQATLEEHQRVLVLR